MYTDYGQNEALVLLQTFLDAAFYALSWHVTGK